MLVCCLAFVQLKLRVAGTEFTISIFICSFIAVIACETKEQSLDTAVLYLNCLFHNSILNFVLTSAKLVYFIDCRFTIYIVHLSRII